MKKMESEAGKMETVRVSDEVMAKINEAKRYEEDPGQPFSVIIERITNQSRKSFLAPAAESNLPH